MGSGKSDMWTAVTASAFLALAATAASAADAAPKVGALLEDGFQLVSTANNGRPGELVLVVRKDAKAFACVVTGLRGNTYGEAPAKPESLPCVSLN